MRTRLQTEAARQAEVQQAEARHAECMSALHELRDSIAHGGSPQRDETTMSWSPPRTPPRNGSAGVASLDGSPGSGASPSGIDSHSPPCVSTPYGDGSSYFVPTDPAALGGASLSTSSPLRSNTSDTSGPTVREPSTPCSPSSPAAASRGYTASAASSGHSSRQSYPNPSGYRQPTVSLSSRPPPAFVGEPPLRAQSAPASPHQSVSLHHPFGPINAHRSRRGPGLRAGMGLSGAVARSPIASGGTSSLGMPSPAGSAAESESYPEWLQEAQAQVRSSWPAGAATQVFGIRDRMRNL